MVETTTIIRKSPIPTIGPVATNTTDKAAGRKIPNPRIPTTFLVKAITKVIIGKRSKSTIVFTGTPEPTAPLIAYLMGLYGQTEINCCDIIRVSKGPKVSSLFRVMSGTVVGVAVATTVALAEADGNGLVLGVVLAKTCPGATKTRLKSTKSKG